MPLWGLEGCVRTETCVIFRQKAQSFGIMSTVTVALWAGARVWKGGQHKNQFTVATPRGRAGRIYSPELLPLESHKQEIQSSVLFPLDAADALP